MRTSPVWTIAPLLLLTTPAAAHFKLDQPASNVQQNTDGNPQKPASMTDGCPSGTTTGMTTQIRAGSQVHVKIAETVPHGGHYRVSFGANEAAFSFPQTIVAGGQCMETTIAQNPTLPILADGLFVHNQTQANTGNICNGADTCETDVTIPDVAPGNYVLQVIQWMLPHGSGPNNGAYGCYYAHCANLQVVETDASIVDGGLEIEPGSGDESGDSPDEPGAGSSRRRSSTPANDGCGVSSANGASLCAPLLGALVAVRALRRRKRR